MPSVLTYPRHEIPTDLATQVRSYLRIQWPHLEQPGRRLFDTAPANPLSPVSFVLVEGDTLISHAEANVRGRINFYGADLLTAGLSSVFTYPAWRGKHLAEQVVTAATKHIAASDADIALLFSGQRLRDFYTRCGWEPLDGACILHGEESRPRPDLTGQVMAIFLTDPARAIRERFAQEPVYVGRTTW